MNRKRPPKATWDKASFKVVTGVMPAVKLVNIQASKLKYTKKEGFDVKAEWIMCLAVLKHKEIRKQRDCEHINTRTTQVAASTAAIFQSTYSSGVANPAASFKALVSAGIICTSSRYPGVSVSAGKTSCTFTSLVTNSWCKDSAKPLKANFVGE